MGEIDIWVPGIPQPGGSKRGFYNPALKRVLISDANPRVKPWRACVSQAASEALSQMLLCPLKVRFDFVFPRPKGHLGTGKKASMVKASAPSFPAGRPDVLKCARAVEDALTGIIWRDDAQIVTEFITKRYGYQAGCRIRVSPEVE